jgi:hypothetical protein
MQPNDPLKPAAPSPLAIQLLSNLEKTLRSYRLYEARGPQYEAHMGGLAAAVDEATASAPIAINLSPFGPYLDGGTAPTEGDYARQWFDLFEEGARQIVFSAGISTDELRELMHVLCGEDADSEDIVTALWRKNLHHINVQVARLLVRNPDTAGDRTQSLEDQLGRWRQQIGGGSLADADIASDDRATPLQQDDFRLLAMDEKTFDWCRIAQEVSPDVRADARRPRLADEIDRQCTDYERFLDLVDATEGQSEQLVLNVLSAMSNYGNARELARFLEILKAHEGIGSNAIKLLLEDDVLMDQLAPIMESAPDVFTGTLSDFKKEDAAAQTPMGESEDPSEAQTEIFVRKPPPADPIEEHRETVFASNPRSACESVNALFTIGSDEAIRVAMGAYSSKSVSVRQLVVIRVLRKSLEHSTEALSADLERVIRNALKDSDQGIRKLVLAHFLKHSDESRLRTVMRMMSLASFSTRVLTERLTMLRIVSQYDHEQEVADYLCDLLLKYRLFSSDDELQFQMEVAKHLVRSENPKAAQSIMKVLKRWTVPAQVKAIIQQEVDAFQHEQENSEGGA